MLGSLLAAAGEAARRAGNGGRAGRPGREVVVVVSVGSGPAARQGQHHGTRCVPLAAAGEARCDGPVVGRGGLGRAALREEEEQEGRAAPSRRAP